MNVRNTQARARIFCSHRRDLTGKRKTTIRENATVGVIAVKFLEEVLRVLFTKHTRGEKLYDRRSPESSEENPKNFILVRKTCKRRFFAENVYRFPNGTTRFGFKFFFGVFNPI